MTPSSMRGQRNFPSSSFFANRHRPVPSQKISLTLLARFERGCAKTPARFHTDLFCSLFRAFRPLGSEKIATNLALFDQSQNFAEFSHSLGGERAFRGRLGKGSSPRHSRHSVTRASRRAESGCTGYSAPGLALSLAVPARLLWRAPRWPGPSPWCRLDVGVQVEGVVRVPATLDLR